MFEFDNSYALLPERFYSRLPPCPVRNPSLVMLNSDLAEELGIEANYLTSPRGVAALSGNSTPQGAEPLAMAYAGHQFGGWVPSLGDGRAILLGEVIDRCGIRRDVQLKGSGRTPFSRMGDGRAWIGPVIREYIVSEAMHALGVPTTRSLAAIATGETVYRESPLPGGILTRVSLSHIRVGTFQYFYARNDLEALKLIADYLINRIYPHAADSTNPALALLDAVVTGQARLIAQWMGLGFIHGVMNTDNMSLACETIDYGPCAFMDEFDPGKVFSSIDHGGRYAYSNQPNVALWNLAQFATALVPLIASNREEALEKATESINAFPDAYQSEWLSVFGRKLGIAKASPHDSDLIRSFLALLADSDSDFTVAFRNLAQLVVAESCPPGNCVILHDNLANADWISKWRARLGIESARPSELRSFMLSVNPQYIPRNHLIEKAISAAVRVDYSPFRNLVQVLSNPYLTQADCGSFALPPKPGEAVKRTFCGT